jgi:transcriptional regulator with GAF, ATPase, and Fis domain
MRGQVVADSPPSTEATSRLPIRTWADPSLRHARARRPLQNPLNLSALSATLIESELFGHKKGAFTGAAEHRTGWLEVCPPLGTVFLDEIGETEAAVQVKLLRVLQTRTFQRVGDTQDRPFRGKIVAATNRSLPRRCRPAGFAPTSTTASART